MERQRAKFVGCQVILWAAAFFMVLPALVVLAAEDGSGPAPSTAPRLFIEPIEGLTTARHLAPSQTAIPLGTVLELFLDVPEDAQVTFSGATITSRTAEGIKATCFLNQEGPVIVAAICEMSDGARYTRSCWLDVVSIAIGDISVTVATPTVAPFDLDENATNEETMSAYFGESIAELVETTTDVSGAVGTDGGRRRPRLASVNRRFRTSIFRRINFHADVNPPAFAPLMEWRFDGLARALGADRNQTFTSVGEHTVSVGPPDRPIGAVVDTYSVSITSHRDQVDIVGEREWITFEAVTDPQGLEEGITWISSTKYGTATPVLGQGPTFTVAFEDTFSIDPGDGPNQWLGVRADNALFGQDQKGSCCLSEDGQDLCGFVTQENCEAAGGTFDPDPNACSTAPVCGGEGDFLCVYKVIDVSIPLNDPCTPAGCIWVVGAPISKKTASCSNADCPGINDFVANCVNVGGGTCIVLSDRFSCQPQ